jgi:hypothetical protein
MNCRQARELLGQLIAKDRATLPELEEHLKQCPGCQSWHTRQQRIVRELEGWGSSPPSSGLSRQVLDRLPDMPLEALEQMMGVVTRAWEEPDLRETLRAAPRQTLEREGVDLPAGVQVVVVPPQEATLPTRQLLALPLPPQGEGPRSAADLRARLRPTAAALLLEPELAAQAASDRAGGMAERLDAILAQARMAWDSFSFNLRHPTPRRMLAPALAIAASLLLVFGLLSTFQGEEMATTPGTAAGTWSWAAGAGLVVVVGMVAVVILWRRRQ